MARAVALTRDAAARWLTTDTINAIGRSVAVSVTRHRRVTERQPTWAEELGWCGPGFAGSDDHHAEGLAAARLRYGDGSCDSG